jgi:hypothetical protein
MLRTLLAKGLPAADCGRESLCELPYVEIQASETCHNVPDCITRVNYLVVSKPSLCFRPYDLLRP